MHRNTLTPKREIHGQPMFIYLLEKSHQQVTGHGFAFSSIIITRCRAWPQYKRSSLKESTCLSRESTHICRHLVSKSLETFYFYVWACAQASCMCVCVCLFMCVCVCACQECRQTTGWICKRMPNQQIQSRTDPNQIDSLKQKVLKMSFPFSFWLALFFEPVFSSFYIDNGEREREREEMKS